MASTSIERKQRITIVALSIAVIGLIVALLFPPKSGTDEFFDKPEGDTVADGLIGTFTNETDIAKLQKYKGVYFDAAKLEGYVEKTLKDIKKRYADHLNGHNGELPAGYELKVGFYWKYGPDAAANEGLGFYVVPLLTKNGKIEDYFAEDTTGVLNKTYPHSTPGEPATYNAYNEGHLFP